MKKVLWYGEYINPTGFAQVTKSLVERLKTELDITVLDWQKQLAENIDNPMAPIRMDGFNLLGCLNEKDGEAALQLQFMNIQKYDCIFILNDVWNINFVLQILKYREYKGQVICYFPVDAKRHSPEWYKHFDIVTTAVTYTKFAYDVVIEAAPEIKHKLFVLPHGVDLKVFYPMKESKSEIRERLFGTKDFNDKFIFLNANRNQPRKRLDITMEAFALAIARDDEDKMRLYMHCGNSDSCLNITELAKRLKIGDKLIMSCQEDHEGMINVPISHLNLIYNACDVGVNTSMGEGWGLTGHEMAAAGKPQIVPGHSACKELFGDLFYPINVIAPYTFDNIMTVGGLVDAKDLAELMVLAANKTTPENYKLWCEKTYERFTSDDFLWSNIAKKWKSLFYEGKID